MLKLHFLVLLINWENVVFLNYYIYRLIMSSLPVMGLVVFKHFVLSFRGFTRSVQNQTHFTYGTEYIAIELPGGAKIRRLPPMK